LIKNKKSPNFYKAKKIAQASNRGLAKNSTENGRIIEPDGEGFDTVR
jgi:hypothetical protein